MNIIKASPADIVEVLYLFRVCVQEMNSKRLFYWDYENQLVKQDIDNGTVFLYKENDVCLGAITLNTNTIEEYNTLSWSNTSAKPLFIHRLLVHPIWREKGITSELVTFAEKYANENGFSSARLNVFSENKNALELFNNLKYNKIGEIQLQYQKPSYFCFEKCF